MFGITLLCFTYRSWTRSFQRTSIADAMSNQGQLRNRARHEEKTYLFVTESVLPCVNTQSIEKERGAKKGRYFSGHSISLRAHESDQVQAVHSQPSLLVVCNKQIRPRARAPACHDLDSRRRLRSMIVSPKRNRESVVLVSRPSQYLPLCREARRKRC